MNRQKLEIIKTTDKNYEWVSKKINKMIEEGNKIISINPVVTREYKSSFGNTTETQMLVFVLFEKTEEEN